jgi:SAM-dependent methyltransferase
VRDVLDHAFVGDTELRQAFPTLPDDSIYQVIIEKILPYTARYWIKPFEKTLEALQCSLLIKTAFRDKENISILDVGSGSGQMVDAIVSASGKRCIVDGFDNFQEKDTHQDIFLALPFARKMYTADFNSTDFTRELQGTYDLILGLNSIRMAPNLVQTLQAFKPYLASNGKLVFNVVTPNFHKYFFQSAYSFAKKHDSPNVARYETGANYIPEAYDEQRIRELCGEIDLLVESHNTYMFLEPYSPYQYFTPAYQFTYSMASLQATLDFQTAEKYATTYARHIYYLGMNLPGYMQFQNAESSRGNPQGCEAIVCVSNT